MSNKGDIRLCGTQLSHSHAVFFVTCMSNLAVSFNFSNVEIALLLIETSEGSSPPAWGVSMLDSLVFVGCIAGMLAFGYVGDRFGRIRGMRLTLIIAAFGAVISGLMPAATLEQLVLLLSASRFFLGVGIGGIYPLSAALAYEDGGGDRALAEMKVAAANFGQPVGNVVLYLTALLLWKLGLPDEAQVRAETRQPRPSLAIRMIRMQQGADHTSRRENSHEWV